MNKLLLFRINTITLQKLKSEKFQLILNFSIFLILFAITASSISIFYESKIERYEKKLILSEINSTIYTKWLNRTPKLISDINNLIELRKREKSFSPIIKLFPDDEDDTSSRLYSSREEYYSYYYFLSDILRSNYNSIDLILTDATIISNSSNDIKIIKKQKDFFNNLLKEFDKMYFNEKKFREQKNSKTFKENQIHYSQYEQFTKESLNILTKQKKFLIDFSLKYFSNKRNENINQNNLSLEEISRLAKVETQLILFAFFIQILIFLVLQFFEVKIEREN